MLVSRVHMGIEGRHTHTVLQSSTSAEGKDGTAGRAQLLIL